MIKVLGDTALLVELSSAPAADSLQRVQAAVAALRALALPEVTEIVPALTTVGVHFRATAHWATVAKRVREALEAQASAVASSPEFEVREVSIPVHYGDEVGPDLSRVATHTGLSSEEIVRRHSGASYVVQAVGFAPGFPYLSGLDPALACPRRETPRLRVAPGSVGIGGAQTGIYPLASPGGWQLIGRTPVKLFDLAAESPALLRAGDRVRFVPINRAELIRLEGEASSPEEVPARDAAEGPGALVEVLEGGLQTTVQDLGRSGYQEAGVTEGGAVDRRALRLANLMVGNPPDAAALEWPLSGPKLRFRDRRICVVMGAIAAGVPFGRPFAVDEGTELDLSKVPMGFCGILAVSGGIAVPAVLGSRSTHLGAKFGGLAGRPLRGGDVVPLGESDVTEVQPGWLVSPSLAKPLTGDVPEVRIIRGPEGEAFRLAAWNLLLDEPYRVGSKSDRMGMRLAGATLEPREPLEMVSQPVAAGTIQVPPDGQPIVLLADRQSLGGYPRIATVISVDLPILVQVPPGGRVRFVECTLAEAEAARLEEERDIALFAAAVNARFKRKA